MKMGGNNKISKEQLVNVYYLLQTRLVELTKARDLLYTQLAEIQKTIESIRGIREGNKFLIPLGSGVLAFSDSLKKDKLLIEIGSDVFVERTPEEGIKILEKRNEKIREKIREVEKELIQTQTQMENLLKEIEKLKKV